MIWKVRHPTDEALNITTPLSQSFHTGKPLGFFLTQITQAISTASSAHGCASSKRAKLKRYTDPTVTETILNYGQTHGDQCWELHCPLLALHTLPTHPRTGSKKSSENKSFPQNTIDKSHSTRRGTKRPVQFKTIFSAWTSFLIKSLLWYWIKMHSVSEKDATFPQSLLSSQHVLKTRTPWIKTALPNWRQTGMALCPKSLLKAMLYCNAEPKFFP